MSPSTEGILDTSALIDIADADVATLPAHPRITAITLAELSVGPHTATDETERLARTQRLQWVEATFEPIPFDAEAARAFAAVAVAMRRRGRKPAARAFDGLIAATAMSRGLPVHTANPRDFASIPGLDVVTMRRRPQDGE